MRSSFNFVATAVADSLLLSVDSAAAATYNVAVGKGGLFMTPNTTVAAVGDIVQFDFYTGNHAVVQGNFSTPCHVGGLVNSFHTQFMRVTAPAVQGTTSFQVVINDTNPIWFYCPQAAAVNHCQSGMSGVINPPASGNTLALYQQNAKAFNVSEVPAGTAGGVLIAVAGINGTASVVSSSATAAASSTLSSVAGSVTSVAASSTSAPASSSSKAAAPAMTLSWEVLAAAGAVVGGAVAYLQ